MLGMFVSQTAMKEKEEERSFNEKEIFCGDFLKELQNFVIAVAEDFKITKYENYHQKRGKTSLIDKLSL